MSVTEALDWLFSTQFFGIKLGLDQTRRLLRAARVNTAQFPYIVHVAGTNGKGSTCAMIEALARSMGLRTGLFTSPHLLHFRERIKVNGKPITDYALRTGLNRLHKMITKRQANMTFFEISLALALYYFSRKNVDFVILETGLGGRLDATNAISKNIAVLTPIGLDHQQYLGDTLEQIAAEKADIIQPRCPVVSASQAPAAMQVIQTVAAQRKAPLTVACANADTPQPALRGEHQRANAALALETMRQLDLLPPAWHIPVILNTVSWQGRFESVSLPGKTKKQIILDGAHNEHAVQALVATWQQVMGQQKAELVFAASADKAIADMLPLLNRIAGCWHLVPCSSPRIMPPQDMARQLADAGITQVIIHNDLASGIRAASAKKHTALVTGSLFLLGDVYAWLHATKHRSTQQ